MQLPPKNYDAMVKRANPPSPVVKDCLWAFFVGGAICLLGEALRQFYLSWYDKDLAERQHRARDGKNFSANARYPAFGLELHRRADH